MKQKPILLILSLCLLIASCGKDPSGTNGSSPREVFKSSAPFDFCQAMLDSPVQDVRDAIEQNGFVFQGLDSKNGLTVYQYRKVTDTARLFLDAYADGETVVVLSAEKQENLYNPPFNLCSYCAGRHLNTERRVRDRYPVQQLKAYIYWHWGSSSRSESETVAGNYDNYLNMINANDDVDFYTGWMEWLSSSYFVRMESEATASSALHRAKVYLAKPSYRFVFGW